MVNLLWTDLFLLLSLVTGTIALTLCFLIWDVLRASAVGQTIAALTVVLGLFSFYHGIELLVPQSALATSVLKSVTFTSVALFVAVAIRFERQITDETTAQGDS